MSFPDLHFLDGCEFLQLIMPKYDLQCMTCKFLGQTFPATFRKLLIVSKRQRFSAITLFPVRKKKLMPRNWCFRLHGHQGEVLIVCFHYPFILLKDRRLPTGIKKTLQKKSKSIEALGKRKCHCWQQKSSNDQLSKHLDRKRECNEKVISVQKRFYQAENYCNLSLSLFEDISVSARNGGLFFFIGFKESQIMLITNSILRTLLRKYVHAGHARKLQSKAPLSRHTCWEVYSAKRKIFFPSMRGWTRT